MTTIVATMEMMAADTRVDVGGVGTHAGKLYKAGNAIIGCAGDSEGIVRFLEWWPYRETKPMRIPKRFDWSALVLSDEGILIYENAGIPDVCKESWAAIGTGSTVALAALDTMKFLGRKPDPRVALKVACRRDCMTGGDVEYLKLRRSR
jgi:hypothetical protein